MEIPKTMKAAVVVEHKKPLQFQQLPIPELKAGEVLVKILYSGVCHTDVHVNDGDFGGSTPIISGHEGCGEVVKLGLHVTGVNLGDRVGIPWLYKACGKCYDCNDGWETVCSSVLNAGFTVNGGFAQYAVAAADFVAKIPDALPLEEAAPILCAGVTVYKALRMSEVKPGQTVLITGASGGLGHMACQYAKLMGMNVMGVTRKLTPEKEEMLKQLGCEKIVDLSQGSIIDQVKKLTGGAGVHGVICLAPDNKDIGDAVEYVRNRGVVVPVAIPPGSFSASTFAVAVKAIKIVGSIVGTRNDLAESLNFAAKGLVKTCVTVRKFEEINVLDVRKGNIQGRVVLEIPH